MSRPDPEDTPVLDILFIALSLGFFAAGIAYVAFCARLTK
jgi:hypothetical protein